MSRAFELLKEIVNLSLPRDVAGHPAVIEARELTGCGQAMGVAPLTPEQTRRFEAALQEAAADGFAAPDPAEAMLGAGILAHAFVNSASIPGRCDTCGLTASAARHRLAPVDPAWPDHNENGLKPPADRATRLEALRVELAEAFDDQAAQNDPDDKNALEAWILDAHNSPAHPFQKAATEYLELADDLAFADMEAAPAAQDPGPVCRVCGRPDTPEHQEYEAAMASAERAVAALPDRG